VLKAEKPVKLKQEMLVRTRGVESRGCSQDKARDGNKDERCREVAELRLASEDVKVKVSERRRDD
jgi:hypothetical protein